jgi:hypothetical protein
MPRFADRLPAVLCRAALLAGALVASLTPAGVASAKHHGAAASARSGVVLSVSHRTVRLVDARHRVDDAHVGSAKGLSRGAVVAIAHGHAHVIRHVRTVTFLGRVVRSSARGAVLRLADNSNFTLGAGHGRGGHAASGVTVVLEGLAPGQAVLVTIASDDKGNVVLTIKLVAGGKNIGDGVLSASGVVTDDSGDGGFAIRTDDGRGLRFADPQRLLEAADASQCDTVDVTYHAARHHRLVADTLQVTGQSDAGACAGQQGGDDGSEIDGTVTAIADDDSSLTVDQGDGSDPVTIPVGDPSLLDGVSVGDQVAVTVDADGVATEVDVGDDSTPPGDGDAGSQAPGDGGGEN